MNTGAHRVIVTGIGVVAPEASSPPEAATASGRRLPFDDDWFDPRTSLPGRGYKYVPSAGQYLLAGARTALADAGGELEACDEGRRGAVVGTNSGVSALHDAFDRVVLRSDAGDLSPATAPFFSVNLLGSQLSTHYRIKGFNVTVTSPRVAGLEALEIAGRSLVTGRAETQLAAATEAPLAESDPGFPTSEAGAVVFVLGPPNAAPASSYGWCSVRTFFLPLRLLESGRGRDEGAARVEDLLRRVCGERRDVARVRAVVDESAVSDAVYDGVRRWWGGEPIERRGGDVGRAGCLEPMLHLANLLSTTGDDSVLVAASTQGNVAVVRLSACGSRLLTTASASTFRKEGAHDQ